MREGILDAPERCFLSGAPHEYGGLTLKWLFQRLVQPMRLRGEVLTELPEVRRKTQETPDLVCRRWPWPFLQDCNLPWIHADAIGTDHVTQEIGLWLREATLAHLSIQLVLFKELEYFFQMSRMFRLCLGKDQYVIHVDHS
jgi:hypothetical protein